MKVSRPCDLLRLAASLAVLVLSQFCFSNCALAQGGATDSVGGRLAGGSITVSIRNSQGEPLAGTAIVHLYTADGIPVAQTPVVGGGQATFLNIQPGSYSVEVEAAGYAKAYSQAFLPMSGGVDVQIYLHAEPDGDAIIPPGSETPLLAPKAKKELDAGIEALRKKDLEKAQKHLEKARQMAPSHPEVLYLMGSLYAQKNDLPQAEQFLTKATQVDPKHAPALAALGIVLSNEHKCRRALLPLGTALELDPKSWEARWAFARCEYTQRNFQSALEQSRQALRDSNGLAPDISLVVAASLAAVGQYEESASLLHDYLRQHPDRPGAARAKAWLDRLEQAGKIKSN